MAKEKNKFDDVPEPTPVLTVCKMPMNDRAEAFSVFLQRMLGTSEKAPFIFGGECLNGASMGAMVEAFEACYPLTKIPVQNEAAARRAALLAGSEPAPAEKQ